MPRASEAFQSTGQSAKGDPRVPLGHRNIYIDIATDTETDTDRFPLGLVAKKKEFLLAAKKACYSPKKKLFKATLKANKKLNKYTLCTLFVLF